MPSTLRIAGRRLPIGAETQTSGGVHFRVWAPRRQRVEVVLEPGFGPQPSASQQVIPLQPEENGYFSAWVSSAGPASRYRFRLDGEESLYPDPASRYQPEGVHGPSEVIDPGAYVWEDRACAAWICAGK